MADEPAPGLAAPSLGGLRSLLATGLAVGVATGLVALLFAAAQAAVLYNQIGGLPGAIQPIAYGFLVLIGVLLLLAVSRLAWAYVRLRRSPALDLGFADLGREMEARAGIRLAAEDARRLADARKSLERLLSRQRPQRRERARLAALGVNVPALESAIHQLLSKQSIRDDREWLSYLEEHYLAVLDAAADRVSRAHARQLFVATALSPRGALDGLAVLVLSYRLVGDLCTIYRLRAGGIETAIILGNVLFNTIAANQLDDTTDAMGEGAGDLIEEATGAVAAIVAGIGGTVVGKASDGAVNALLLVRLKARTQAYLRPVRRRRAGPIDRVRSVIGTSSS